MRWRDSLPTEQIRKQVQQSTMSRRHRCLVLVIHQNWYSDNYRLWTAKSGRSLHKFRPNLCPPISHQ